MNNEGINACKIKKLNTYEVKNGPVFPLPFTDFNVLQQFSKRPTHKCITIRFPGKLLKRMNTTLS